VQRLEQVRLPSPVRAGHEDDAGLEDELELGVRAEFSERGLVNDQPADPVSRGGGSA
jgi:hypothetical protein